MSVKITDNTASALIDIDRKVSLAIRYMLERVDATAEPKTPRKFGNLRRDVIKQVLGKTGTIAWPKKYAAAQEAGVIRGSKIRNYTTAGTGPHYAENAVKAVVASSEQDFRKAKLI